MYFEKGVNCCKCKEKSALVDWIRIDSCPVCGTDHIIPNIKIILNNIKNYNLEGSNFLQIIKKFELNFEEIVDILIGLDCKPEATLDFAHRFSESWTKTGWRKFVKRTRQDELENIEEIQYKLEKYGIYAKPILENEKNAPLSGGVDLFNEGKYYKAHEVWEEKWKNLDGQKKKFFQGLIQTAAVYVHQKRGNPRSVFNLSESALDYLENFSNTYIGINVKRLKKINEEAKKRAKTSIENEDIPLILRKFELNIVK